jgi:hypothetical protein
MNEQCWTRRPPPQPGPAVSSVWHAEPVTLTELAALRRQLRTAVSTDRAAAVEDDCIEWLLLAFEELTSNGVRHGRPPVQVDLTASDAGWLLDVSDAAPQDPPIPAVGRDPGAGGMGLFLVARTSAAHGWAVSGDRKHVWAQLQVSGSSTPAPA